MRNAWFAAVPILVAALWGLLLWSPARAPQPSLVEEPDAPTFEAKPRAAVAATPVPVAPRAVAPEEAFDPELPAQPAATQPTALPRLPPPSVQGPIDRLKSRYQGESSTGSPPAQQQQLTAAFTGDVADLLDNVECRSTVCRVRLTWQPKHGFSGMQQLAELRRDFDPNLAIDRAGPAAPNGAQTVDVYIDLTSPRPKVP